MTILISNIKVELKRIVDVVSRWKANFGIWVEILTNGRFERLQRVSWNKIYFKASKIVGCELVRQADMPFDFDRGFCNTFDEKALMCFHLNNSISARKCRM